MPPAKGIFAGTGTRSDAVISATAHPSIRGRVTHPVRGLISLAIKRQDDSAAFALLLLAGSVGVAPAAESDKCKKAARRSSRLPSTTRLARRPRSSSTTLANIRQLVIDKNVAVPQATRR